MPSPFPYSSNLQEGTYNINSSMNVYKLCVRGLSSTSSSILCDNPIVGGGLPSPSDITLDQDTSITMIGDNFGALDNIRITVPSGGSVDILIEKN